MAVKALGVVLKDLSGSVRVELRTAANTEEVETFINANIGQEVEIVLTAKEEPRLAGEAGAAVEGKGLDRGSLSPCSSAHYWQGKDKKES